MERKENVLRAFWRDTYRSKSPIPYILSAQVLLFVLIHFFDLLKEVNLIQMPLYDYALDYLRLPLSPERFLTQPWSLITYSFLYTGLFHLLFDCLWLYWIGNTFLNFLNKRQFLFVYISSILTGGILYVLLGFIPILHQSFQTSFSSSAFAIGALVASIATLVPQMHIRLFLFGNVQLKTIAIVYTALQLVFIALVNKAGAVTFLIMVFGGILFTYALQRGNDWSLLFKKTKPSKLKVVHRNNKLTGSALKYKHQSDLPNQDEIDYILDKISVSGYDSLTSYEKETLFRVGDDYDEGEEEYE